MPLRTQVDSIGGSGEGLVSSELVDAFSGSMPSRYRVLFDPRAIRKHAAIAYRREGAPAHAELWRALPDGSAALCVVAEDRAGLLSLVAAALMAHRLDVITALVFSRVDARGQTEAVDLFWTRRLDPQDTTPIDPSEAMSIGQVLSALLSGAMAVDDIAPRPLSMPPPEDDSVVVRFEELDEDGFAVLIIEAADRAGMLLAITRALFDEGAQVVRSLVRTAGGRVHDRFELCEQGGDALTPERRAALGIAVEAAIARHKAGHAAQ